MMKGAKRHVRLAVSVFSFALVAVLADVKPASAGFNCFTCASSCYWVTVMNACYFGCDTFVPTGFCEYIPEFCANSMTVECTDPNPS